MSTSRDPTERPLVIVLMGVSGAGKTFVGRKLADALGWRFIEGDDHHPPANRAKMQGGIPLDDDDRWPWLEALRGEIAAELAAARGAVLACSALKARYRDRLRVDRERVRFVHLEGDETLIAERLSGRAGHFMPESLLPSQLETLESPSDALVVDAAQSPARIIREILGHFGLCAQQRPESALCRTSAPILEGLAFPEAPRWREGRLWFTDQHAQEVRTVTEDGASQVVARMGDKPGGLGWLPDGRMLVVAMTERRVYRREGDEWTLHADLSALASFHCNDMLVDEAGRAYVGNFGYDLHGGAPVAPAELIVIEPDGRARVAAQDLVFPNGMALTPDRETLIVGETFAHRLSAFALRADGTLSERRTWADVGGGTPDGICLDVDGAVWFASPFTGDVRRIGPDATVRSVVDPVGTPYACMLGGADRRTLFVLTSESADPDEAARLKTGRIETCRVDVPGAGLP